MFFLGRMEIRSGGEEGLEDVIDDFTWLVWGRDSSCSSSKKWLIKIHSGCIIPIAMGVYGKYLGQGIFLRLFMISLLSKTVHHMQKGTWPIHGIPQLVGEGINLFYPNEAIWDSDFSNNLQNFFPNQVRIHQRLRVSSLFGL